jgi:FlaA1/EpsC-like NDP-sugar epimerase
MNKYLSNNLVLFADIFIISTSVLIVWLFSFPDSTFSDTIKILTTVLFISFTYSLVLFLLNFHKRVLRFLRFKDVIFLFNVLLLSYIFQWITIKISVIYIDLLIFDNVTLLFSFLVVFTLLIYYRFLYKYLVKISLKTGYKQNACVYCNNGNTFSVVDSFSKITNAPFKLYSVLSDSSPLANKTIFGIQVHRKDQPIVDYLKTHKIKHLFFDKNKILQHEYYDFLNFSFLNNIKLYPLDSIDSLASIDLSQTDYKIPNKKTYKSVDLLERDSIITNNHLVEYTLINKTVLVTGGAGSIGSEIVRQICNFEIKKIVILDNAETALNNLELELLDKFPLKIEKICFVLDDIRDSQSIEMIFKNHLPDIVIHAGAYKHVPQMERHFNQAVKVNIFGTKNILDLSIKYNSEKFIFISTDKAVYPESIMGASKRFAEQMVLSLYKKNKSQNLENTTDILITRFGNVLSSNGSVLGIFQKQIDQGKPLTITHPDVTRYFLTVPEAARLVLESIGIGIGGQIYLFEMGESVKIKTLADTLIRLNGLIPGEDVKIVYTGLRPGEKLYEELYYQHSKKIYSHHKKIIILIEEIKPWDEIQNKLKNLITTHYNDKDELLKELIVS